MIPMTSIATMSDAAPVTRLRRELTSPLPARDVTYSLPDLVESARRSVGWSAAITGVMKRILGFFGLGQESSRQTSIGTQVPHPLPESKEESIANIEYVRAEVQRCERSITHSSDKDGDLHELQAEWYLQYIAIALKVAQNADVAQCSLLSEAALQVLPRINPYAEEYYDCDAVGTGLKKMRLLRKLASEYKRASITLGKAILEVDPNAPSMDKRLTFKEDYESLLRTILEI